MNKSSRSNHLKYSCRRKSYPQSRHIPLHFKTDDNEEANINGDHSPKRLSLSIRQPSFLFLSSDLASHGKLMTKDGNILSNQNTIVFEPDFSDNEDKFTIAETMRNLCNKSIYNDLTDQNSTRCDILINDKNNLEMDSDLCFLPFISEEAIEDPFSNFESASDNGNENFNLSSNIPRDKCSQIQLNLRQINIEKWNKIGYAPPLTDMKYTPFF